MLRWLRGQVDFHAVKKWALQESWKDSFLSLKFRRFDFFRRLIGHDRGRFLVTSSLLLLSSRPENEETDFLICDSLSLLSCIILNGNININWNYDDLSLKRYRILEFLFVFLEKIKEGRALEKLCATV